MKVWCKLWPYCWVFASYQTTNHLSHCCQTRQPTDPVGISSSGRPAIASAKRSTHLQRLGEIGKVPLVQQGKYRGADVSWLDLLMKLMFSWGLKLQFCWKQTGEQTYESDSFSEVKKKWRSAKKWSSSAQLFAADVCLLVGKVSKKWSQDCQLIFNRWETTKMVNKWIWNTFWLDDLPGDIDCKEI